MAQTLTSTDSTRRGYPNSAFPDGWYLVATSAELAPGEVRAVRYFGEDLVLFRGESGEVALLDAYCPHMGAHLGYGGCVEGDGIRCPFHKWRFDVSGRCDDVPYERNGNVPGARLASWKVVEADGLIMVCYDGSGRGIDWCIPRQPKWGQDGWIGYESVSYQVRMHVQEVAENVPDTAHFLYVHGFPVFPEVEVAIDGDIYRQDMIGRDGDGVEIVRFHQTAYQLGMVWLDIDGPPAIKFLTAATPIDSEKVELRLLFLVGEGHGATGLSQVGRDLVKITIDSTAQDIPIWEHKIYRSRPQLVAGDGPIFRLRRWARQFYLQA
jgi:3-ketosteroid 9alpha-monooxygenase subunit A